MTMEMPVSEQPFNYEIDDFDGAIEYISDMIGSDFDKAIKLTNAILANPEQHTGPQALITAVRLSGFRVKVGVAAQKAKLQSAHTKKPTDRLVKDALMVLYDGLLELINCLKAVARNEREVLTSG